MLLIFGLGYSGRAIARAAVARGWAVTATTRGYPLPEPGVTLIPFTAAHSAIAAATHILSCVAPDDHSDPVLNRYAPELIEAKNLRWLGYLSTTGVYGDAGGGWVDETTRPKPGAPRTNRRVAAESAWAALRAPLAIFRLGGIYGPGRSMLDDLRAGTPRHVLKPGHMFGRIHRDDIAHGVLRAMERNATGIFNFVDDEPAESAVVLAEAARLLGVALPPPVEFETAWERMSPMARSFWAENRKVANARTKAALELAWLYPSFREGLAACLVDEAVQGLGE